MTIKKILSIFLLELNQQACSKDEETQGREPENKRKHESVCMKRGLDLNGTKTGTHFLPIFLVFSLFPEKRIIFIYVVLLLMSKRRVPKSQVRCLWEKGTCPGIRRQLGFQEHSLQCVNLWLSFLQPIFLAHSLLIPFLNFHSEGTRSLLQVWIWRSASEFCGSKVFEVRRHT